MQVFPHCVPVFYGHRKSIYLYFVYSILIGGALPPRKGKFFIVVLLSLFSRHHVEEEGGRDVKIGKYKRQERGEELETRGEYEKVEHVTLRAERHGRKLKSYFAVVKFPRYETRKSCY